MKNSGAGVKRILIVDDETSICAICRIVLTGEGFEVDCAPNGRVAQDMIEEKQYDLCLLDMKTPKMDGRELYEWLQKKYPQLSGRVIFSTGDVMGGDTQFFLKETGQPFLLKPFTPEELRKIVRETLEQLGK